MFEIKIQITTPGETDSNFFEWNCSDTRCFTEKGKRDCCCHCPILIAEKHRDIEIANVTERVENIFYQSQNTSSRDVETKIIEMLKEKPIRELR
jgi:hypothetical protein